MFLDAACSLTEEANKVVAGFVNRKCRQVVDRDKESDVMHENLQMILYTMNPSSSSQRLPLRNE